MSEPIKCRMKYSGNIFYFCAFIGTNVPVPVVQDQFFEFVELSAYEALKAECEQLRYDLEKKTSTDLISEKYRLRKENAKLKATIESPAHLMVKVLTDECDRLDEELLYTKKLCLSEIEKKWEIHAEYEKLLTAGRALVEELKIIQGCVFGKGVQLAAKEALEKHAAVFTQQNEGE